MNVLITICARGGSKGIKNKNIKNINGKPLISYSINQALKSNIFNEIVVSTDSKLISKISKNFKAESWFLRPKNLSNDKSEKIFMQNINGNNNKYLNITYYSLLAVQGFEQYLTQRLFHKHCQQLSTLKSSFHYL